MNTKEMSPATKEQFTEAIACFLKGIAFTIPTNKTPDTRKGAECIVEAIEIFANLED